MDISKGNPKKPNKYCRVVNWPSHVYAVNIRSLTSRLIYVEAYARRFEKGIAKVDAMLAPTLELPCKQVLGYLDHEPKTFPKAWQ
ncbi:hypothetical protein VNO77_09065 [Canavalia gladiata]|uniref:Uncharacterized protein n=1 Tax=Canavalia gladiata TaxID=3824 RepID=A0AAN9M8X3_CANGL